MMKILKEQTELCHTGLSKLFFDEPEGSPRCFLTNHFAILKFESVRGVSSGYKQVASNAVSKAGVFFLTTPTGVKLS
jgi:hypothetical protein